MPFVIPEMSKRNWAAAIFQAKAASTGGIIRRKKANVLKYCSMEILADEVRKRGFWMIESNGTIIILCHPRGFKILVRS